MLKIILRELKSFMWVEYQLRMEILAIRYKTVTKKYSPLLLAITTIRDILQNKLNCLWMIIF